MKSKDLSTKYIKAIKQALKKTEKKETTLPDYILNQDGMNGHKTLIFYNELVKAIDSVKYFEIGIWRAWSTMGALFGNKTEKALVVDNWSQFGNVREDAIQNISKLQTEIEVIEADCFEPSVLKQKEGEGYNIYIYDGLHTEEAHYMAVVSFLNILADTFVFIVDDWNWREVRQGTLNAISDAGLVVKYVNAIKLNEDDQTTLDKEGWWNGVGIFVLSKQ